MRLLAHELVVADENQIAVVKNDELWMDDNRWEVFLSTGQYRLNLATRELSEDGLAPAAKGVAIPARRRQVALEQVQEGEVFQIIVAVDGRRVMEVEEPKGWNPESGWSGDGKCRFDGDNPIALLLRRCFMRPDSLGQFTVPNGPTEGILLWIEQVK